MRYFVTGTDTDVGKTRVCAALARALRERGQTPTIVKLVQTGLSPGVPGDADDAARLSGCDAYEFVRFPLAADPWNAALHAGSEPLEATALAARLDAFADPLVIEGSGGAAVPLNERETLAYVAARARCEAILVVALRLGCINHALLTLAYLAAHDVTVRGAVFVERTAPSDDDYRDQVRRALDVHVALLGNVPFDPDATRSVSGAATLFTNL
ncbi:MAG: dethiobiotin synthase [Candidatus Eremiobacteraeota bacterium]|nr:dethiobiotin synthase [Candidatus Eremiobacteraeota bacterium]MBC5802713.1 dethiobiotin synthase [Candidatus Eremiobacteraeota bacterium]MBC5821561.1 dethiobiotin synthase [Candidatus Eremiobacteraeota bacterium]